MLLTVPASHSQEICGGDVDGSGSIAAADVSALLPLLFQQDGDIDPDTRLRADANADGSLNAADVAAVLQLAGYECFPPPSTPAPTATDTERPTSTQSSTPTPPGTALPTLGTPTTAVATPTPSAIRATPTPTCLLQVVQLGTTSGELTSADCRRAFGGDPRYADTYSFAGTPGTVVTLEMAGTDPTSPIMPFARLIDGDGQFDSAQGAPPLQFVVSTTQPYRILVSSAPSSPVLLGPYSLTLSAASCPTPVALTLNSSRPGSLDDTDCPDPAGPAVNNRPNPADIYTFTIGHVPANISITMRESSMSGDIDPALTVIGPDGFEVAFDDDSAPGGLSGSDAQARFLALQPGAYTIVAGGGGGRGGYMLSLIAANCRVTDLKEIPETGPLTVSGTLYGDVSRTACAAPLRMPGTGSDAPELSSPADVYTFTADAGDVIGVEMRSDDDAHLYLLGPSSAGNPLVARDDNGGPSGVGANAQLAATLVARGTYTIVAANNNALLPPDPPDPEDQVNYTLVARKCPVRGGLNPNTGRSVLGTFSTLDCFGFGGVPYRSYAFVGTAGQFVSATVTSPDIDPFVRLYAPDGSRVENDRDLFTPVTSDLRDARANRILPVDGTYFVEVSTPPEQGAVDVTSTPAPAFSVRVRSCATSAASPGTTSGTFQDSDCDLGDGRKYDVYSFPGSTTPNVASILPPSNGCIVALLADGLQLPGSGCRTEVTDIPITGNGRYGFIVAANDAGTRGGYTVSMRTCPLSVVTYGDQRTGALTGGSCSDAADAVADWYLLQARAGLVNFNFGVSGDVSATFSLAGVLTNDFLSVGFTGAFAEDPGAMLSLKDNRGVPNLAVLLRIAATTQADRGSYMLSMDPASYRE